MRIMSRIAAVAAAVLIGGSVLAQVANPASATWSDFTSSRDAVDKRIVAGIAKMEWWDACIAWGREAKSRKDLRRMYALQEFLRSDNTINGKDLGGVTGRSPEIGMTVCGVLAAMGRPDKINQTETASQHHSQLVYRSRGIYVYTDGPDANGVVRSIQH